MMKNTDKTITAAELISERDALGLPDSAEAWIAAGKPLKFKGRALLLEVKDEGKNKIGRLVYVTDDGWAGVRLAGEIRCDEWPADRLIVD